MRKKILVVLVFLFIIGCAKQEIKEEVKQMGELKISSVFENNGKIPSKYTCQGDDINPELSIAGIPSEAKSLVLINIGYYFRSWRVKSYIQPAISIFNRTIYSNIT